MANANAATRYNQIRKPGRSIIFSRKNFFLNNARGDYKPAALQVKPSFSSE